MLEAKLGAVGSRAVSEFAKFKRRAGVLASRSQAGCALAARGIGAAVNGVRRRSAGALAAFRSESLRARLTAMGAFTGLALVLAASLDFLLSGGPDFNQSAEAAPYRASAHLALTALPEIPYTPPAPVETPPAAEIEEIAFVPAGEALLGGPLPGDAEGGAPEIVYDHEGPAPFGEYEIPVAATGL